MYTYIIYLYAYIVNNIVGKAFTSHKYQYYHILNFTLKQRPPLCGAQNQTGSLVDRPVEICYGILIYWVIIGWNK